MYKDEYDSHSKKAQVIADYLILTDILLNKFGLDDKVLVTCNPLEHSVAGRYRYYIDVEQYREIILNDKHIHTNKLKVVKTICHELAHAIHHDIKGYTNHDDTFYTIYKSILPKECCEYAYDLK
jgi:hypothetical protein